MSVGKAQVEWDNQSLKTAGNSLDCGAATEPKSTTDSLYNELKEAKTFVCQMGILFVFLNT